MSQKRFGEEPDSRDELDCNALVLTETARSAGESSIPKATPKNDDEHISVFWRVFGGTLLSMVALGAITLYNSISSNIAELRADLNHEREARSDLMKKDEFNTRTNSQYERFRALDGLKPELEGLKERVNSNVNALDSLKKDTVLNADAIKKEIAAAMDLSKKDGVTLEVLKEKLVSLESLKKDVAGVEVAKEKLMSMVADMKMVRDDLIRIQQEQERNKAADLERKASRDAQHRQIEETLKELQKGLQDCREKLARLEGSRGTTTSTETAPPPVRPGTPPEAKGPN